jgi:hypothetical protein
MAVGISLYPCDAHADIYLGADADLASPVAGNGFPGVGVTGRLGWRFNAGPIYLQPEIEGSYLTFDADNGHIGRFLAGGRLGLDTFVQPSIYGHAGWGWLNSDALAANSGAFDVGVSLDVRLVRHLLVGVQMGYNVVPVTVDLTDKWVNYGVNAAVIF